MNTCKIGDISFSVCTYLEFVRTSEGVLNLANYCHQVVLANAYSVSLAKRDLRFQAVCKSAEFVLPDGYPIVWISAMLNHRIPERIAGPDFMLAYCRFCALKGYKVFFLGGTEDTLRSLQKNLQNQIPGLNVAGSVSPPFGEWSSETNRMLVDTVNKSGADVLWVGVSTPKQDKWIQKYKHVLNAKIAMGVGAAFDFHSGNIRRAPKWMQRIGFEWLHRLASEPTRLWKRYLIGNIRFLLIVGKQVVTTFKLLGK